jgi:uncharacterized lipoprotein YddW (UPF0748 family)
MWCVPWLLGAACANLLAAGEAGTSTPAPPGYDKPLIDDFAYRDAEQARAAWQPMGESGPVSAVEISGRRVLRLPCDFAGTQIERASWDRKVTLDLTACRGVRFEFYCSDVRPVSHFSFYLHSGNGWYSATFGAASRQGWSSVLIDKTDTQIEGQPAGWGSIDTIRISAWRGTNVDTEFYLANLAADGADAPLVIVRGESAESQSPGEARSVAQFSKTVASALDELGLPYVVMSDRDVTAARLQGKSVAILPYNPRVPDETADELTKFLRAGGKLQAFYVLPARLAELTGIGGGAHVPQQRAGHFASIHPTDDGLRGMPPVTSQASWNIRRTQPIPGRSRVVATWFNDQGESTGEAAVIAAENCVFMTHVLLDDDPAAKRLLLLAMLGHLDPRLWTQAARNSFARLGRIGPYANFEAAARAIRETAADKPRALAALAAAEKLRADAIAAGRAGKFAEALNTMAAAQEEMLTAYCAAQEPQPGEHRAWWCHSALGVSGMTWDQAIRNLADHGFTAILPNMLWGGVAYYNSQVLPVAPEVRDRGDQIAACVAACRKYGVACHVWKVNWNMGHAVSKDFMERMHAAGRTQVSFDGQSEPRWLCPSHPDNQQLEIDSMVEVATKYDVDGIHFDYIRYPGADHCFCPGCRARFEAVIGNRVANWPADTRKDQAVRQQWLDFRRSHITRVVAAVHDAVKKQKPSVQISAAVFRNWPVDRDGVGQDWKLWCDRGYLDFVCPMDYTPNDIEFETIVSQQREWAGKVPCYPGIGISTWSGERDVAKLIEHIKITRRLQTGGFTIFNYAESEADRIVPLCGQGITRKE